MDKRVFYLCAVFSLCRPFGAGIYIKSKIYGTNIESYVMAKLFTYELTILENHLDTFRHVNHAVYLDLFEEARWDLVTKGGWSFTRVQQTQVGPIVLEVHVKYRKELRLREKVTIETTC